ncbi:MAG: zinc transporter ZupT [Planctomycetes bacterium]|nr:zinc transporter ZupT [Planctomycetota bacterium]
MDSNVLIAFLFTALAGLSTGIGSAIAFFANRTNTKFLAGSLGFSAGVMIYVSFVELLAGANADLIDSLGSEASGNWAAAFAFFAGMAFIAVIDKLVPEVENPHEVKTVEDMNDATADPTVRKEMASFRDRVRGETRVRTGGGNTASRRLMRTGYVTALVIAIHNFPEGLATFMSTIEDASVGFSIAIAIAIHNIPEGIAVSVPIYYATGDKKKAFTFSFLSGLTEPLGAIVGYMVLRNFMTPTLQGLVLAAVAGIMVFISLDELLPSAERYGEHHLSIYGAVFGMAVMAISLLLLA